MEIAANLASFSRVELPAAGLKAASVAVCIVLQQDVRWERETSWRTW